VRRDLRLGLYIAVGVAAGMLIAFAVLFVLTRTDFGMERARRFAVQWLEERVQGELRVGRITGPGLLRGVMVHDVEIVDERGRLFLRLDSARVAYDWRTLLRGRIVLDRATLYQPIVNLERLPGDTLWNYELVFPAPERVPDAERSLILFQETRVVNGTFALRRPWEPDGLVEPEDTARIILEEVPGGLAIVWRFDDINAQLGRILWESPIEQGQLFEVRSISTQASIWRDPLPLRDARGVVTRRDSLLTFDMPEVQLPASRAAMLGTIVFDAERNLYDVRIDSNRFLWRDLRWILPTLPAEGGGSMVLHIQSQQPRGVLFHVSDARLAAPGTRLAGNFGIVAGDTLYFTDVNLRASPLNLDVIEAILPGRLPVEGLLVGTVEVRGPLSSLETSGDVHFASHRGGDGGLIRWSGSLEFAHGVAGARRLAAELQNVDLGYFSGIGSNLPLSGRVSGRLDLSGRVDGDIRFDADLRHSTPGRPESRLEGGGTARRERGATRVDLLFRAEPVSLDEYLAGYAALLALRPEIRGPVRLLGRTDSLSFEAEIATTAGSVQLAGLLGGGSGPPRYEGTGRFQGFRVDVLAPQLPETRLSGAFAFDLTNAEELGGRVAADFDSARFAMIDFDGARFRGAVTDGMLVFDTLVAHNDALRVHGTGDIALDPARTGTLSLELVSHDLEPLENAFFDSPRDDLTLEPRLSGRLRADATLRGAVSLFDLETSATLQDFVFDDVRIAAADARLRATELRGGNIRIGLDMDATDVHAFGHDLPGAGAVLIHEGNRTRFAASGGEDARDVVRVQGSVVEGEEGRTVSLEELRLGSEPQTWALRRTATIGFAGGEAVLDGFEFEQLRGQGMVSASGRLAWRAELGAGRSPTPRNPLGPADAGGLLEAGGPGPNAVGPRQSDPLDFEFRFEHVPFAEFLRLARSEVDADADVSGRVHVGGAAAAPFITGEATFAQPRIAEAAFENASGSFRYADRRLHTALEAFLAGRRVLSGSGTVPLDLALADRGERRLDEPLDVVVTAEELPAATVLGLLDGFTAVQGRLDGTIALRGTTLEPKLEGGLVVTDGSAIWDATGVRYRDVTGTVSTLRDRVLAIDLTGRALDPRVRVTPTRRPIGPGSGRVTGTIDFATASNPGFDLAIRAEEVLAARRRDAEVTVTGNATLRGRYREPVVGGSVRVDRGALYLDEIYRQYLIVDLQDPLLFDAIDTAYFAVPDVPVSPFLRHLVVDNVRIAVGQGAWLRSRDMNVEVTGDVTVALDRVREDFRLSGSLRVLRGTYQLYYPPLISRRFDVQQGSIDFPGTPGLDPNMAITAVYRAKSITGDALDITANVTGSLAEPRVRLSSNAQPPISESDLASYLFFGAPTNALAPNAAGGGAGEFGMRAFGPSALGYVSSGLQTLAQSTGFIDYVGLSAAETLPGQTSAGLGSVFSDAQLEIGLYLSPEMFVAFTKRLNSASADAGVRLEWRFHPTYTAEIFAEDRFARTASFGFGQIGGEARKIYGLWLFREFGY
jgi:translocation and assembly module TamB